MERMQREGFRRRMFNEQSSRLLARYPDLKDEVAWRVAHLNSKWETLELAMTPSKGASSQRDMCTGECCCSRRWLGLPASQGLPTLRAMLAHLAGCWLGCLLDGPTLRCACPQPRRQLNHSPCSLGCLADVRQTRCLCAMGSFTLRPDGLPAFPALCVLLL